MLYIQQCRSPEAKQPNKVLRGSVPEALRPSKTGAEPPNRRRNVNRPVMCSLACFYAYFLCQLHIMLNCYICFNSIFQCLRAIHHTLIFVFAGTFDNITYTFSPGVFCPIVSKNSISGTNSLTYITLPTF